MVIASSSYKKAHVAVDPPGWFRWLDYLPVMPLAVAAIVLALAPPLAEPHLWRDIKLLVAGQLLRTVDILDFWLHATLLLVLALKLVRVRQVQMASR